MFNWLTTLLRALLSDLQRWLQALVHLLFPPACPISWQPSALAPVFYGVRECGIEEGAPGPCLVFFPSLDGAVASAPILEGCGRYPLVLFAHGHCAESEHFKKWSSLCAWLSRAGYVVVLPRIPTIEAGAHPSGDDAGVAHLAAVVRWMREGWEHRSMLLPPPATGVLGHSFGALLGARFAREHPVSAYASIAGTWEDWSGGPRPIEGLSMPMFFCLGTDPFAFEGINDHLWSALSRPRHKVIFEGAGHWDYLRPGTTSCEGARGPCARTQILTRELMVTFFGKYLPPEGWPSLPSQIPENLIPPELVLTPEQEFFAGLFFDGFSSLEESEHCQVRLTWDTVSESGTTIRP